MQNELFNFSALPYFGANRTFKFLNFRKFTFSTAFAVGRFSGHLVVRVEINKCQVFGIFLFKKGIYFSSSVKRGLDSRVDLSIRRGCFPRSFSSIMSVPTPKSENGTAPLNSSHKKIPKLIRY